jgi:hypothetical protein
MQIDGFLRRVQRLDQLTLNRFRSRVILRALLLSLIVITMLGISPAHPSWPPAPQNSPSPQIRDGQHDFDFNLGTWKTHIRYLRQPAAGPTWVEFDGTVVVRKVWDGRAQLEEIEADGSAGHFEGLTLFLYNPESHQWSQNFASSSDGTMSTPSVGEFKDGRGEFYSQEPYHGKTVLIRGVWSDINPDSHRFEQSFSKDGGKTWEPNFIAVLTREKR